MYFVRNRPRSLIDHFYYMAPTILFRPPTQKQTGDLTTRWTQRAAIFFCVAVNERHATRKSENDVIKVSRRDIVHIHGLRLHF